MDLDKLNARILRGLSGKDREIWSHFKILTYPFFQIAKWKAYPIRIGSPDVGMATAMGLGVKMARLPPNGATEATEGSELTISMIRPSRAGASR